MLVFKPNFDDSKLPPFHLMQDLYPFSHAPYAFAYEQEDYYYAFSANVSETGFNEPKTDKTLEEWTKERFFATDIRPTKYPPGQFYKRMWRPPGYLPRDLLAPDLKVLTQSALAAELLIKRMQELFLVLEPAPSNLAAFGHKIREILLLACMEVEASWVGVLREHEYIKNPYTTNDYVKLLEPMCLGDYEVRLRWYPDFPSFKPFECWEASKPTQSLSWYNAYNATKHDRETNLQQATLANAVHSVGAAIVMFCAQFGIPQGERLTELIYSMFDVRLANPCPERSYIPLGRFGGIYGGWTPKKYDFFTSANVN